MNTRTGAVTFASWKRPLKGREHRSHALTSSDIFDSQRSPDSADPLPQYVAVSTSLFDARLDTVTHGDTHESGPRFRIAMDRKGVDAIGADGTDPAWGYLISFSNMAVSMGAL